MFTDRNQQLFLPSHHLGVATFLRKGAGETQQCNRVHALRSKQGGHEKGNHRREATPSHFPLFRDLILFQFFLLYSALLLMKTENQNKSSRESRRLQ